MPPKKGKKGKAVKIPIQSPDRSVLIKMQRKLESLTEGVLILKAEAKNMQQENDWINKQIAETQKENEEYIEIGRERLEKKQKELDEIREASAQEIDKMLTYRKETLTVLEDKHQKVKNEIDEKRTVLGLLRQKLTEMEPYRKMEEQQLLIINELKQELTKYKKQGDIETRKVKNAYLLARDNLKEELKQDINRVETEIERYAHPCMTKRLSLVQQTNITLKRELLTIALKKDDLQERRDALKQQLHGLLQEKAYWEDLEKLEQKRTLPKLPTNIRKSSQISEVFNKKKEKMITENIIHLRKTSHKKKGVGAQPRGIAKKDPAIHHMESSSGIIINLDND